MVFCGNLDGRFGDWRLDLSIRCVCFHRNLHTCFTVAGFGIGRCDALPLPRRSLRDRIGHGLPAHDDPIVQRRLRDAREIVSPFGVGKGVKSSGTRASRSPVQRPRDLAIARPIRRTPNSRLIVRSETLIFAVNIVHRSSVELFLTAMASARLLPTRTTSRLPRVRPVPRWWSRRPAWCGWWWWRQRGTSGPGPTRPDGEAAVNRCGGRASPCAPPRRRAWSAAASSPRRCGPARSCPADWSGRRRRAPS